MGTTTCPPVPQGLYNECRREYLSDVHDKIEKHNIPGDLTLNVDQTPSSYTSVGKSYTSVETMAIKGTTSVPIKGIIDKRYNINICCLSLSGE